MEINSGLNWRDPGKGGKNTRAIPRVQGKRILSDTTRTLSELQAIVDKSIADPMHKALFSMMAIYGCRISEALAVRKRDVLIVTIKEKNNLGQFVEKIDRMVVNFKTLKNRVQIERSPPAFYYRYKPFIDNIRAYTLLFSGQEEDRLFPVGYNYCWRLSKIYFGRHFSPHWFRHYSASYDARRGFSPALLMKKFGWSFIGSAQPYTHLNQEDVLDAQKKQQSEFMD